MTPNVRRLTAEFTGAAVLTCAVVGSGIMAAALTPDVGLQLVINAVAAVAALGVLIAVLGPVSGAHFNPAVTLVATGRKEIARPEAARYVLAQTLGAITGALTANIMFGLAAWHPSQHERGGTGLWLGEVVATGGLLLVIGALTRTGRGHLGPLAVPAWIGAAYFFTASTSFANPAVTIGRAFSDTFAGIAAASVPIFIAAQLIGAALGAGLAEVLYPRGSQQPPDLPEPVRATEGVPS